MKRTSQISYLAHFEPTNSQANVTNSSKSHHEMTTLTWGEAQNDPIVPLFPSINSVPYGTLRASTFVPSAHLTNLLRFPESFSSTRGFYQVSFIKANSKNQTLSSSSLLSRPLQHSIDCRTQRHFVIKSLALSLLIHSNFSRSFLAHQRWTSLLQISTSRW